jgi:hypothetical protein
LSRNSTRFGQFLCPSSGVHSLYIRHLYMSSNPHDIYQGRMYSGKLLMTAEELPETCRVS